jgi:hypothetical protein
LILVAEWISRLAPSDFKLRMSVIFDFVTRIKSRHVPCHPDIDNFVNLLYHRELFGSLLTSYFPFPPLARDTLSGFGDV